MGIRRLVLKYIKRTLFIVVLISIVALAIIFIPAMVKRQSDTATILQEIQSLNRWETASFTIEKIIDQGTSGNPFQEFLFGNKILLIAHGEAVAGFNLSTLSQDSVHMQQSSIVINLPKPEILYTKLDNDKTRVYDRQQGLLTKPDKDLESQARLSAENAIRTAACTENILTIASDNARKQLTSLLSSFNFTSITISIPQGKC